MSVESRGSLTRPAGRKGFTLLELIIVLVVLAALAALVVPTLGYVREQARYATSAAAAGELMNNLELYRASTGKYPDRLDSLVGTNGQVYSKLYNDNSSTFTGQALFGAVTTDSSYGYWFKNGSGIAEVVNHNQSTSNPNESTDSTLAVPVDATPLYYIDGTAFDPAFQPKVTRIIRTAFPNQSTTGAALGNATIPPLHKLVALGVGPRNSAVGGTMTNAPSSIGMPNNIYSRYIAVFDVTMGPTGRGKAQLKMILDSDFEVLAKNIENFKRSGPTDDQAKQ